MGAAASTEANTPLPQRIPILVFSGLLLVSAIIQIGFGAAVYSGVTNVHLGAWWAGAVCAVSAIICLAARERCTLIWGCVVASISIVIAVAASIGDGIASAIIKSLTACVGLDGKSYGSAEGSLEIAFGCMMEHTCTCTDYPNGITCFFYDGPGPKSGCDYILNSWTTNLAAASALDGVLTILVFCLSVTTCVSLCSSRNTGIVPATNQVMVAPAGGYVQMQPVGQQALVFQSQPQVYGGQQVYAGQQPVMMPGQQPIMMQSMAQQQQMQMQMYPGQQPQLVQFQQQPMIGQQGMMMPMQQEPVMAYAVKA